MSVFGTMKSVMTGRTHSCNCIGPQNGEPLCPCQMRSVIERGGRWISPEGDLGPVRRVTELGSPRPTPTDTGGR